MSGSNENTPPIKDDVFFDFQMAPLKLIPTNHNTYQKVKYFYGS